jgi:predicted nucleic acid-binding protein
LKRIFERFVTYRPFDHRFGYLSVLNLSTVGHLDLLRQVYQEVVIPPAVAIELRRNGVDFSSYGWLILRQPTNTSLVEQLSVRLDPGEAEAVALALELNADRVLIDERRARRVALEFQLRPLGLLGVIAEAKQRGFLQECKPVVDEMIELAGFWIGKRLYEGFLDAVGE